VPCRVQNAPSGWVVYINKLHGFCFSYPPVYTPVAKPWLEKYASYPQAVRKAAQEGRLLRLQHQEFEDASIQVLVENKAFDLQNFVKEAPTGIESPPEPAKFGNYTFYYYGTGGGGVCYPDQYFFNLHGKTLHISFDGPCVNDKTPTPETKEIEHRLLQTFRTF